MASVADVVSTQSPDAECAETRWQKLSAFLVRRRVRISVIVFLILILEDVLVGIKPHDIANFRDTESVVGLWLVVAGVALRSWAAGILHKNEHLSRSGPYGVVRHPLYIGSFMMMVGFCTLIDDWENIWIVLGPFLIFYVFRILREEQSLSVRFGSLWQEYVQAVPRFLPRRLPKDAFADWSRKQWTKNREYRTASAAVLGLIGVELWRKML